ncbi:MAG TPA: NADH-quinone oxidoreductase subunit M, partial [Nitrospiria bacterium]|nr:NADH-quinone oxidoreductase subunit M [Nitrospiria bacterium]
MDHLYLTIIFLAPLLGASIIVFLREEQKPLIRWIAAGSTAVSLFFSLIILILFDRAKGGIQFEVNVPWVKLLGISWHLGVDGIGMTMVLLTSFIIFTGVFVSFSIEKRVKEFFILLLVLVTGVYGVFTTLDLFFFYFFYELAVIPMYLLIGVWGSTNKEYATMKLTLYLTFGAVIALVPLLALYMVGEQVLGHYTFDLLELGKVSYARGFQVAFFLPLLIGFGILVPMWPFHSWSPGGHAAAPSAVSMLHAGVLMKLGAYGIIRVAMFLFPEGAKFWLPVVAILCMANILYGGYVAMSRQDMKFMIGYSSSSHMGYVLLGMATLNIIAFNGAVLLMFAHGIMTGLAFALVGFIYDQSHTRLMPVQYGGRFGTDLANQNDPSQRKYPEISGLAKKLPFIGVCFVATGMASAGLPGFANFASEFMILVGTFKVYPVQMILATFGVVITAIYYIRAIRAVFFGQINAKWEKLQDASNWVQRLPFVVLLSVLLIVGFYPSLLVNAIQSGTTVILERISQGGVGMASLEGSSLKEPEKPDMKSLVENSQVSDIIKRSPNDLDRLGRR